MLSAPPAGELSEDIDELARIAANVEEPLSRRNAAFSQLVPCIGLVAQRVAMRFSSQARTDLPGDALLDIWERLPPRDPADPFEPGCYTVLRNLGIDRARHEQTERRHSREAAKKRPEKIIAPLPGDHCLPEVDSRRWTTGPRTCGWPF